MLRRAIAIGLIGLAAFAPAAFAGPYNYDETPVTLGGQYAFISATGTGSLATGSAMLEAVVIGSGAPGAWIRLWDSTSTAGATISDIAATNGVPVTIPINANLSKGLTYQASASAASDAASFSIIWN